MTSTDRLNILAAAHTPEPSPPPIKCGFCREELPNGPLQAPGRPGEPHLFYCGRCGAVLGITSAS